MIDVNELRHPKEKTYYRLAALFGGLMWLCLILTMVAIPIIIGAAISLWLGQQFFKAAIYGNAVRVSERQYPEIHKMVMDGCRALKLENPPDVFILNGEGAINALAIRFMSTKYVLLYSSLVDLMVEQQMARELKFIIGHELGHHAAGHTHPWKSLLIAPARVIPMLGMAFGRACEFTADRLGAAVCGDLTAAKRSLVTLAVGSKVLKTDLTAFAQQEREMPALFASWSELYSTHPRLTRRVIELDKLAPMMPKKSRTAQLGASRSVPVAAVQHYDEQPIEN